MGGLGIHCRRISMILVQMVLASILSQDYSRLPAFMVIQRFHVTRLILMFRRMELGICIFCRSTWVLNQGQMIGEGPAVV